MKVAIRGCERSGTNALTWLLRERYGLEIHRLEDKHLLKRPPMSMPCIVIVKHPIEWCDSLWRHGMIWDWMQLLEGEDRRAGCRVDLTFEEFVLQRRCFEHFHDVHREWLLHKRLEVVPFWWFLRDGANGMDRRLAKFQIQPVNTVALPLAQMTMNAQPSRIGFVRKYYLSREWQALTTPALEKHMLSVIGKNLMGRLGLPA